MSIDPKMLAIALMVAIDLNAGKASKEQGLQMSPPLPGNDKSNVGPRDAKLIG